MSETKTTTGLDWDDDEVTKVDSVVRLPMTEMVETDRIEREKRSRKQTIRIKPIKKAVK